MTTDALHPAPTAAEIDAHVAMLEERVFQVRTKWPHFRLLLADARRLAEELPAGAVVASLERTLLYGGYSLFAPIFARQNFISVDCSPDTADARGAYNGSMIDDPRTIRIPYSHRGREVATGLPDAHCDAVLVPNLVHHVADQARLFGEVARVVKPGGRAYVFEPILRELHQMPDDYLRYTPYGLRNVLDGVGFDAERIETEGGPFQAIAYCWEQALQYFPEEERTRQATWFWNEHFPQLLRWDEAHRRNLVRKFTSFPVAFSILARRRGA
jgi:SAM-dependent methyltransferase